MALETKPIWQFGPFRLNPAERLLLRHEAEVRLPPKAFDLLVVLVSSSGRLLDKDELLKQVWPGTFVEESSLAQHVSLLRKALQDGEGGITYIDTVPKRGYRFAASVQEIAPENPGTMARNTSAGVEPVPPRRNLSRLWISLGVVAAILLVTATVIWQRGRRSKVPGGKVMVVVLPFDRRSGPGFF
jgi:DNA-binding winged helix-turn-helix (wHTH) protein